MSLLFDIPHVVCACGRIYFEGDSERLWTCAREHVRERQARERAEQQMAALSRWDARARRAA